MVLLFLDVNFSTAVSSQPENKISYHVGFSRTKLNWLRTNFDQVLQKNNPLSYFSSISISFLVQPATNSPLTYANSKNPWYRYPGPNSEEKYDYESKKHILKTTSSLLFKCSIILLYSSKITFLNLINTLSTSDD